MSVVNIQGISHHRQTLTIAGNKHYEDGEQQCEEECNIYISAATKPLRDLFYCLHLV